MRTSERHRLVRRRPTIPSTIDGSGPPIDRGDLRAAGKLRARARSHTTSGSSPCSPWCWPWLGAGIGLLRQTTYTASATLQVGQVNPNSPGFLGYVQSASSLATAFSRSIAAAPVLATVKRKLALGPADATPRLSAEPIPLAPAFRVIATGSLGIRARSGSPTPPRGAIVVYENRQQQLQPAGEVAAAATTAGGVLGAEAGGSAARRTRKANPPTPKPWRKAEAERSHGPGEAKGIEHAPTSPRSPARRRAKGWSPWSPARRAPAATASRRSSCTLPRPARGTRSSVARGRSCASERL